VLLVHFIVVLAPLTALLAIVCAVWPSARKRLIWLVAALSIVTIVLTPLTTSAGEWLEHRVGLSPLVHIHAELGDTMLYFSLALLVAVAMLAFVHVRESRNRALKPIAVWLVTGFVVLVGVATTVQVYRIGDSGATATWREQTQAGADAS
jgi:VanZ family protein